MDLFRKLLPEIQADRILQSSEPRAEQFWATNMDSSNQEHPIKRTIGFQVGTLIGMVLLCLAVGAVGGFVTAPQIENWYADLQKPSWNPPSWVFGPVWTTLYVMMAVSAWLVIRQPASSQRTQALIAFAVQLIFNFFWSLIFFGLENPMLAFADIVLLWGSLVLTVVLFWRNSIPASLLLVPYLAWVTFASALNFAIWQLNP